MNIREVYDQLASQELSLKLFNSVVEVRNECRATNNYEYFYLNTLLMIDIYINEGLFDDALALSSKSFLDLDKTIFQKIYVSVLERLIYIFIQKKNYRRAFIYANEKRLYIDVNNQDEVNRWYLENSYIYEALGEKHKSLSNLLTILTNNPDDNLKVIILGNITKLYIDDGDMSNALTYLEETMVLSNKLKDKASQLYCDYLNAKLLINEKKYKFAFKLFKDIFKNLDDLDNEQINYLNEFCELLLLLEDYQSVKKYSDQYLKTVEATNDQFLKKNFYKNYLKALIMLLPGAKEEITKLLNYTDLVEKEIIRNNEENILEANEDDKQFELNEKLQQTITSIENTINLVNLAMVKVGERESLLEFSKSLAKIVPFNEALYIIFNRANFELLPDLHDSFSSVTTFNYKKERLYERELPYSALDGTIIELLISGNKDVILDFNDTNIPIIEPITKATYLDLKVKYVFATPLNYDGDLYACVVYTSTISDITSPEASLTLKIASKLLESKLINLFYQENLQAQKDILQTAMSGLQEGLFYYEISKQRMLITPELASFLGTKELVIARGEYLQKIIDIDKHIHAQIIEQVAAKQTYHFSYNLSLNGQRVFITEHGKPYFSKDGILKFYICSIVRDDLKKGVANEKLTVSNKYTSMASYFTKHDLTQKMQLEKQKATEINYHLSVIGGKFKQHTYMSDDLKNSIIQMMHQMTGEDVYLLDSYEFIILSKTYDSRTIDRWVRQITNELCEKNVTPFVFAIKYPKDFSAFDDLIDVVTFMIQFHYFELDEVAYKEYLYYKTLNQCISLQVQKSELELLYAPLYMQKTKVGYEVKANIGGIQTRDDYRKFITNTNLIALEKQILNKIMQASDSKVLFVRVNADTLHDLISQNYFANNPATVKPYLLIDGESPFLMADLQYLKQLEFRLYLDYQTFQLLRIGEVYQIDIDGLMIDEDLTTNEKEQIKNLALSLKYQLVTKAMWTDYRNCLYHTEELISEATLVSYDK